jgi:hypothetical protein
MHELTDPLLRRVAEQLAITGGRAVARGRLVVRELVGTSVVELVERSLTSVCRPRTGSRSSMHCSVIASAPVRRYSQCHAR